jgi:ketosteroid isomerase-like protein
MLRLLKRSFAFFTVISVLVGFATAVSAQGDVRASIEASNKRWENAVSHGDAIGIASLYTGTAKLFPPNSKVVSGQKAIKEYWKGAIDSGFKAIKLTSVEVEAHGDTAYEVGKYTVPGEAGKVLDAGDYVILWKRANGQWKMHRDIWTTNTPSPQQ